MSAVPSERLATSQRDMALAYDVVVVGSGYGGGIAACRLSRRGLRVAVLERGREWSPEDFPESAAAAGSELQVRTRLRGRRGRVGSRTALFDLRVHDDASVLVGCGLGGTSLINANAFVEPPEAIFADERWPAPLRRDAEGRARGAALARDMLSPRTPARPEWEEKAAALARAGRSLGLRDKRLPLLVETEPTDASAGCNGCGNCVTGCRRGAKRTVDRTYLIDAKRHGAHLFTEVGVSHVERAADGWLVRFDGSAPGHATRDALPFLRARAVVLAAGVFGSTEILARSRARGLAVSDALGTQVSGNGNRVAVVLGAPDVSAQGGRGRAPGPCILGAVEGERGGRLVHLEEGTLPSVLEPVVTALALRSELGREPARGGWLARAGHALRAVAAVAVEHAAAAARPVQVLLLQGHDAASGTLRLDPATDDLDLSLPDHASGARVERARDTLRSASVELGGELIEPALPHGGGPLAVHPLGGCPMGDDATVGVVDHLGRVFDARGQRSTTIHEGLFVCDASVIPASLGINPVATLCALAERAVATWDVPGPAAPLAGATRPGPASGARHGPATFGATFRETFVGWLAPVHRDDVPSSDAEAVEARLELILSVDDVDAFLADPEHRAEAFGTLASADLPGGSGAIAGGRVWLFADDPVRRGVFHARYELPLGLSDGRVCYLSCQKTFDRSGAIAVYREGTSLTVAVRGGGLDRVGALEMPAGSVARTILELRATGGAGGSARAAAHARFAAFFARRWLGRALAEPAP